MTPRTVLKLTGEDRISFLDGLITNSITRQTSGIVYAALLTPQGKYIADFFVVIEPDCLLIDMASSHAPALAQRLNMYRLRADVQITQTDLIASRGLTDAPVGSHPDPRHPALGWRCYGALDTTQDIDWDALRVTHLIPETGIELTPDSYILEHNFEALNGVDFTKGCFVGQEIVARMKHKTTLKKGLARVSIDGPGETGQDITSNSKFAGTLHTISGDQALAYLRLDRTKDMKTQTASLRLAD